MTILTRIEKTEEYTKYYQKFGDEWMLHREDGPAIEWTNGDKVWYIKGERHREDGPAIEYPDGYKAWYIKGKCHREDGPAVEWEDGRKDWYIKGEFHREDGPAIEYPDGYKAWYFKGKRHREDGPAVEWENGLKEYFLNGTKYTEEEYDKAILTLNTRVVKNEVCTKYYKKIGEEWKFHREDGPAIEWVSGRKEWYIKGKRHRIDEPAIEWADGRKDWYIKGKPHREDGPAIERENGFKEYYLNGTKYTKEEYDKEINQNKHSNESNETILSTQKAYFEKLLEKHGYQESVFQEIVKIMMLERTNKN